MTKVERLTERVDEVSRKIEADNRRGPPEWFGFHAPVHPYDPENIKFDILNRHAWEYFCILQMKAVELDEYAAISIWNAANGSPLITYGASAELVSQAEGFRQRREELEKTAQLAAEELDRKDPNAFPRWKQFYKVVESESENAEPSEEPSEAEDQSIAERFRSMWGWTLQLFETYREYEKAQLAKASD